MGLGKSLGGLDPSRAFQKDKAKKAREDEMNKIMNQLASTRGRAQGRLRTLASQPLPQINPEFAIQDKQMKAKGIIQDFKTDVGGLQRDANRYETRHQFYTNQFWDNLQENVFNTLANMTTGGAYSATGLDRQLSDTGEAANWGSALGISGSSNNEGSIIKPVKIKAEDTIGHGEATQSLESLQDRLLKEKKAKVTGETIPYLAAYYNKAGY